MSGRHAENVWADRERIFGKVRQLELLDDGAPKPPQTSVAPADANAAEAELDVSGPVLHAPPPATRRRRGGFVNRFR